MIGCGGLPRGSLRLPWAEEVIGLSARLGCQGHALPLSFQPAWVVRAMRYHWAFQPAWDVRAMRYHCLFCPLRLSGTRRESLDLDTRMIRIRSTDPEAITAGGGHLTNSTMAMRHDNISPTDATGFHRCRAAVYLLFYLDFFDAPLAGIGDLRRRRYG